MTSRSLVSWLLLLALITALLASLFMQGALATLMTDLVLAVRDLGLLGVLLYGLIYIVATMALLPASLLTLGAGLLYGPLHGAAVVLVFSMLGAVSSFLLARGWLRPWVTKKFSSKPTFQALDARIHEEGWKLVFLLRLSPLVPFVMLNYFLGLTNLRLRSYVLASSVAMIPGILLYCYIGSAMSSLSDLGSGETSATERGAFWAGMAATALLTIVLARWAKQALRAPQTDHA